MHLKCTLFCALSFLFIGNLSAQDIHNTLFNYSIEHPVKTIETKIIGITKKSENLPCIDILDIHGSQYS